MFTFSALKRLALVALVLLVSVALPGSTHAGPPTSDDAWLEASADEMFDYTLSLLLRRPPLPGLQEVAAWVDQEYPRDLNEADQKILAAGLVHEFVTFSRSYPGLVTRTSLYELAANPLSPENRQDLAYFDRARSYRYLAATKAQMQRDPVYAAEIDHLLHSPLLTRPHYYYQPPMSYVEWMELILTGSSDGGSGSPTSQGAVQPNTRAARDRTRWVMVFGSLHATPAEAERTPVAGGRWR